MDAESELWAVGVRTGMAEPGDRKLRTGDWNVLLALVDSWATPNGTYVIRSQTRRCVLKKTGSYGEASRRGTVEVVEDSPL